MFFLTHKNLIQRLCTSVNYYMNSVFGQIYENDFLKVKKTKNVWLLKKSNLIFKVKCNIA